MHVSWSSRFDGRPEPRINAIVAAVLACAAALFAGPVSRGDDGDREPAPPALAWDQASGDYVLHLEPGWNLVSLPVLPDTPHTADLFAGEHAGLLAWTADTRTNGYRTLASLTPLAGYWIFSRSARDVRIPATRLTDAGVALQLGWNLVGPAAPAPQPAGPELLSCAWGWEAACQTFLNPDGWLESGKGYWLYCLAPVNVTLGDSLTDTDGDQLLDVWEASHRCDYLTPDTDGDTLTDFQEVMVYKTRPDKADSDDDGMPDAWEIANHYNPLDATDAAADSDLDGLTNLEEFQADLNPHRTDAAESLVPRVRFATATSRGHEGDAPLQLELVLLGTPATAEQEVVATVAVETGLSTAAADTDYQTDSPVRLVFTAACRSQTLTVALPTDDLYEAEEVLLLAITAVENGAPGTIAEHRVLIADRTVSQSDSDHDGLPDSWELHHFGHLSYGATDDPDGDGADNLTEYHMGRHPAAGVHAVTPPQLGLDITGVQH